MCKGASEDVKSSFSTLWVTMNPWWDMFKWFGTPWAMSKTVKELMLSWKSRRRMRRQRSWNLVPCANVGCLDREREREKKAFERGRVELLSNKDKATQQHTTYPMKSH